MSGAPGPGLDPAVQDEDFVPGAVERQGALARRLRLVLALALLIASLAQLNSPVERSVDELLGDLAAGRVSTLSMQVPERAFDMGYESLGVSWTTRQVGFWPRGLAQPFGWLTSARGNVATYRLVVSDPAAGDDGLMPADEDGLIRAAAAQAGVPVAEVTTGAAEAGARWNWLGIATLVAFVLLLAGPRPRLATRWAWFWLFSAGPMAMVFVLVEPVPAWRAGDYPVPRRRLTGFGGLLLGALIGGVLNAVFPGLA